MQQWHVLCTLICQCDNETAARRWHTHYLSTLMHRVCESRAGAWQPSAGAMSDMLCLQVDCFWRVHPGSAAGFTQVLATGALQLCTRVVKFHSRVARLVGAEEVLHNTEGLAMSTPHEISKASAWLTSRSRAQGDCAAARPA